MTRQGPFWGSMQMSHLTSGPSHLPPPAGWPIFTVTFLGPRHNPLIPAGVAEMSLIRDAASALWGHLQIQASLLITLEGGRVFFKPDAN